MTMARSSKPNSMATTTMTSMVSAARRETNPARKPWREWARAALPSALLLGGRDAEPVGVGITRAGSFPALGLVRLWTLAVRGLAVEGGRNRPGQVAGCAAEQDPVHETADEP